MVQQLQLYQFEQLTLDQLFAVGGWRPPKRCKISLDFAVQVNTLLSFRLHQCRLQDIVYATWGAWIANQGDKGNGSLAKSSFIIMAIGWSPSVGVRISPMSRCRVCASAKIMAFSQTWDAYWFVANLTIEPRTREIILILSSSVPFCSKNWIT